MSKFSELLLDVMNEKNITIKDLEENGVLGKNTFYLFNRTDPSLITILKLCNFLKVSIDYLLDKSPINKFKKYSPDQLNFYKNLSDIMNTQHITISKLCNDLGMSRTSLYRWKDGTLPSFASLMSLSGYLNCSIDDLLEKD